MKLLSLAAVAVAVSLAFVPLAGAKSPPAGKYDCVIGSNSILFGTLVIGPAGKYTHRGSHGTFTTGAKSAKFTDGKVG